jgi:hypothetical protein
MAFQRPGMSDFTTVWRQPQALGRLNRDSQTRIASLRAAQPDA